MALETLSAYEEAKAILRDAGARTGALGQEWLKRWAEVARTDPRRYAEARGEFRRWAKMRADDLAVLEAEVEAYERENPGAAFDPRDPGARFWHGGQWKSCHHPSQARLLRAFTDALGGRGPRLILCTAGNQSGKSMGGADCMWRLLLSGPGKRAWAFATTMDQSILNQQLAMWEVRRWSEVRPGQRPYTPSEGFGPELPRLVVQRADWGPGADPSTVHFKSYAAGVQAAQSGTLDMIWLDEAPPEDLFDEVMPRIMVRGGILLITATYIRFDSVWDRIQQNLWDGRRGDWVMVALSQEDNPAQSRDKIEQLKRNLPPDQIQARIYGVPTPAGGLVFPAFRQAEPFYIPATSAPDRRSLRLIDGIDFHASRDIAYLLCGVDQDGRVHALEEMLHSGDLGDMARRIWELRLMRPIDDAEWENMRRTRFRMVGAETGWSIPQVTLFDGHVKDLVHVGVDVTTVLAMNGIPVTPATRIDVGDRAYLLHQAMIGAWCPSTGRPGPGTLADPKPMVIVTDRCPALARQITRLQWSTYKSSSALIEHDRRKDRPVAKDNDLVDILGYIVVSYPQRQRVMQSRETSRHRRAQFARRGRPPEMRGPSGQRSWASRIHL